MAWLTKNFIPVILTYWTCLVQIMICKYFPSDPTSVFLLSCSVKLSSHRRSSFQNTVVQAKKNPKWMMSMLTAYLLYYHHNQAWQKKEVKNTKYFNKCEECSFEVQHALYWRYLTFATKFKCPSLKIAAPENSC